MKKSKTVYKIWTKKDIKIVLDLWEKKTLKEIAEELDCKVHKIGWIAKVIRRNGYKLPSKKHNGQMDSMVKEVLAEYHR